MYILTYMKTTYWSSVSSTETNRFVSSMVTDDENTIKLIYALQAIILMMTLDISGILNNGHSRTFRMSYTDYDYGEVCANGYAPCVIKGDGNYMITVDEDGSGHCKTFGDGP